MLKNANEIPCSVHFTRRLTWQNYWSKTGAIFRNQSWQLVWHTQLIPSMIRVDGNGTLLREHSKDSHPCCPCRPCYHTFRHSTGTTRGISTNKTKVKRSTHVHVLTALALTVNNLETVTYLHVNYYLIPALIFTQVLIKHTNPPEPIVDAEEAKKFCIINCHLLVIVLAFIIFVLTVVITRWVKIEHL